MRWGLVIVVALVAVLLSGCSIVPTPQGRALFLGDVAYATADDSGQCTIESGNRNSDYGKELNDVGKHSTRDRTVEGGAVCYAGSGITDNLKAAFAALAGFLLAAL